ncbi:hypothetical protein [Brucella thiophenivorans]|nr:hypothetical protein [Brucella thiophenivorans]
MQQPLRMHPAQRMIANPELAGVVGDNDGIAQQAVVANRTPDARFRDDPNHVLIEDVDTFSRQVFQKGNLVAKALRRACFAAWR